MRRNSIRLKRAHRYAVYIVLALLFLSGAIWACFNHFAEPNEFASASKSTSMKIHGAAAMAMLLLIGMLLNGHAKFAWRARRNRANGSIFLSALAVLAITGYGLYYTGGEQLRACTSWIHLAVGLVLPVLLILHVWLGKKTRQAVQQKKRPHSMAQFDIA
jgi:uncharacterized membrane protein